jgi:hypothetical protein
MQPAKQVRVVKLFTGVIRPTMPVLDFHRVGFGAKKSKQSR